MKLLVDIGNTRAKWALAEGGSLTSKGAVAHRGAAARDWTRALDDIDGVPERILVANVAGPGVAHALGEWALDRYGRRAEFVHAGRAAAGIENSYQHPESLGVDRGLGMIGAWQRTRAPLVCIAAGTALTIDAVDASGRHAGGLIVPGYQLMVDALLHKTSEIAQAASLAEPKTRGMLGCNTAAGIDSGARQALAAVSERAVRWFGQQAGVPPKVYVGGGDATRIQPLLGFPFELATDLVLEGLAMLAEER